MESEIKSFEDYIKDSIEGDNFVIEKYYHIETIKEMIDKLSICGDRSFIYNHEDNRCYYIFNNKLYKLSVTFEEIEV